MKSTLQSKIAVAMWVMTAVSTLASAILTGVLLVNSHRESIRQQLQATATSLVTLGITHFSELRDFEELNRFVEDALQMDRVDKVVRIYDGAGELLFTTAGADYDRLPDKLTRPLKKPRFLTVAGTKRVYESLVMPYEAVANKRPFYLQVAIRLPPYTEILESLWWQSLLLLSLLIGISVFLSQWVSRKLLMPVGIVAQHLKTMDPLRIEEWRPLAIGQQGRYLESIINGINLLSDRTRGAITKLRKMSRYVAHEMRTPLTILQGEAEMALMKRSSTKEDFERVLRSSLEEIQRMAAIVDAVLKVGEDARTAPIFQPESIELGAFLREHKPMWERTLGRPIAVEVAGDARFEVRADPILLARLIDNLVRNTGEHAPPRAVCAIRLFRDGPHAAIAVVDDGPGLADDICASLNREGSASDAAGVGLNLCCRIAELSGIRLRFLRGTEGGLQVELRF